MTTRHHGGGFAIRPTPAQLALKPHLSSLLGALGFTTGELTLRGLIAFLPLLLVLALWWVLRPTTESSSSAP